MANQDSFIDEVNEEVRRDRLFGLFRRYGWIAILLVILIVGGAAWNEWRKAVARGEAEARGDALLAVANATDPEAQRRDLDAIDTGGNADVAALLGLYRAGVDRAAGNASASADDLAEVAANPDASAAYRDLATLKSVIAAGAGMSAEDRIAALQGLALPGAPFRLLAQEQIALAEVDRGNIDVAREQFTQISEDTAASQGLRRRAVQMIVALGGPSAE